MCAAQVTTRARPKSTAFTIDFEYANNSTGQRNPTNLQDAFLEYKKYKQDGLELARKYRERNRRMRSDPERMWNLRMRFIAQAKKYFGVPYAKKYFAPGTPEYNSSIFLDCCGLVRRVMRDLERDFGFRIGPGNQAYMFDTLPKTIHNIKDVKPGDLVFISGIYYNPKMKKQRHNMTHVEIMLGEGEKTIGARWNNGKVQIFDSYKFTASSFHSPTYYFKSIDTWLLGLCRSFCSQHLWLYKIYIPTRKSIFAIDGTKKKTKKKKSKKKKSKKKKLKKKTSTQSAQISSSLSQVADNACTFAEDKAIEEEEEEDEDEQEQDECAAEEFQDEECENDDENDDEAAEVELDGENEEFFEEDLDDNEDELYVNIDYGEYNEEFYEFLNEENFIARLDDMNDMPLIESSIQFDAANERDLIIKEIKRKQIIEKNVSANVYINNDNNNNNSNKNNNNKDDDDALSKAVSKLNIK